jgi:hypothetical protein
MSTRLDGRSKRWKIEVAAMARTATTVQPVAVTEVREADLTRPSDTSVAVKEGNTIFTELCRVAAERGIAYAALKV